MPSQEKRSKENQKMVRINIGTASEGIQFGD
jgi:hypothetical protein